RWTSSSMSRSSASSGFSASAWKGARKTPVLRNLSFIGGCQGWLRPGLVNRIVAITDRGTSRMAALGTAGATRAVAMIQPKPFPSVKRDSGRGPPVIPKRQACAAATAALLVATACSVFSFSAAAAPATQPPGASCEEAAEVTVLPSPLSPWKGAPLRVVVASEKPIDGELSLIAPNGGVATQTRDRP